MLKCQQIIFDDHYCVSVYCKIMLNTCILIIKKEEKKFLTKYNNSSSSILIKTVRWEIACKGEKERMLFNLKEKGMIKVKSNNLVFSCWSNMDTGGSIYLFRKKNRTNKISAFRGQFSFGFLVLTFLIIFFGYNLD